MTLAKNKVINIDRYFASFEVSETELDTAESNSEQTALKVEGIQPYQPNNYTEYLAGAAQKPTLELGSENLEPLATQSSEKIFAEKLSKLLKVESAHLVAPLPADLTSSSAGLEPAPKHLKSRFGLGLAVQAVLIMIFSSLGLKLIATADFSCNSYQVCQSGQALLKQAETSVKAMGIRLSGQTLPAADAGQNLFQAGLKQAYAAALLVQTASTPAEWEQASQLWQAAIDLMQAVPPSSEAYDSAQAKLSIYQYHQQYAIAEVDPFREAVNAAMDAALAIQSASSSQEYQKVSQQWLAAIQLMEGVDSGSQYYDTAQRKIAEYAKNLSYSQSLSVVDYGLQLHQPKDQ